MRLYMDGLVSEDFFERQAVDRTNLLQSLDVEFLLVAQDEVTVGLVSHGLLLKFHDVVELEVGQCVEDYRVDVIIETQALGSDVTVQDATTSLWGMVPTMLLNSRTQSIILSFWVMM